MIEFVQGLQWWHWWIAAAILAVFETFLPGAVAIWFAAAAVVVGALLLVIPIPWQIQLVLFGVLGLIAIFLYRRFRGTHDLASDQPLLNQRAAQYVGQIFTLIEPLSNGTGKVRVGDSVWLVNGTDLPVGARVRVRAVRGSTFEVEAA
jgi:membrane protein implicated in regulation of membrane protease activity